MKYNKKPYIVNTVRGDLPVIYCLFEASIKYQESKQFPSWRNYDRQAVENDVESRSLYKVVVDGTIAIVFTIRTEDAVIWRHHENGDAVYLHRIVVNPQFKGQRMFGHITDWAIEYCKQHGLKYVRMDTWANNPNLIRYYCGFGFRFIENYRSEEHTSELQSRENLVCRLLLEKNN